MSEMAYQVLMAGAAALFTGLLLFVAEVLGKIFTDMSEAEFGKFMKWLYKRAGYSIFVIVGSSAAFFGMFAYPFFYGFADWPFLVGLAVFNLALVVSRFTNNPIYDRLLTLDADATAQLVTERRALIRANWLRASIALAGTVWMLAALAV
jgi:hypothetical protein